MTKRSRNKQDDSPSIQVNIVSKSKLEKLTSDDKLQFIIDEVKHGNVLVLEHGLTAFEQTELIKRTMEEGGIFTVKKISSSNGNGRGSSKKASPGRVPDAFIMLEDLLGQFERIVGSNKRIKQDFETLLRKKFVEKAEEYGFLDPFAGEFEYADHKIRFMGNTDEKTLIRGVTATLLELAEDLNMTSILKEQMGPFGKKYARQLETLGVSLF